MGMNYERLDDEQPACENPELAIKYLRAMGFTNAAAGLEQYLENKEKIKPSEPQ